jgi:hypothetical protein
MCIPPFGLRTSRVIVTLLPFIWWYRQATKYYLITMLEAFYQKIKKYDFKDTNGILQYQKKLRETTKYGYLTRFIGMGWHPTLKLMPISVKTLLKLNPKKEDKQWSMFLEIYLNYHWKNPKRAITKNKLDTFLEESKKI